MTSYIYANGGDTNTAEHKTIYNPDSKHTTTFKCTGTTLNYSCKASDDNDLDEETPVIFIQ